MGKITLVTGGARSGKSSYAEYLCKIQNNNVAYIATAIPFDEGMTDRIKKHKESRPKEWTTYEIYEDVYKSIKDISKNNQTVILDCIGLLVNNLMFKFNVNYETCTIDKIDEIEKYIQDQVKLLIREIKNSDLYFVIVTNEVGMSIVADNRLSRIYTDILGRINQLIAKESDTVYLLVSGIPVKIKG
ncbi:adenosylcobinamide kinase /adenosylcobinamide-phosphate guanylyltransferase [Alkalithermobacter thermoalcaliphilus JW-YL-7 = DSM 7308]|uniref:Adenosylcobinamide kinase n=1 Tax=Alkalithermobacter thermoalcaliphilus JW-YL-7 = DSM 7308 TaxID=1121328 RepID=A0A150FMT2_CLOPD|nr:Adenosylcobinamide-phosphate guanylyltransferase [[Clostridium] paradoxum JW-YL-7 = DSM 7308]SHL21118.1 adenosylcobinamide kinase /adenosylcobinamide-phosphate guanylyltransferase [[Clostridium] paradoxum JW-YL-7 = DSM 7308]